jgi:hypothetical protein
MRSTLLALLVLALLTVASIYAGDHALRRVETAQALQCARASDGTDQSICDCYTSRNLPIPEGMK